MTTGIKNPKTKIPGQKVLSQKTVTVRRTSEKAIVELDEVGLGVLLNSELPRSFKNRKEMDAHIRWLREE